MTIIENNVMTAALDDELLDEAIEVLKTYVFNEEPEVEFVEALLETNKELITEADEVGFYDPVVREKLMKATSMFLIAKPWLKDTDGWIDEIFEEFEADVLAAYDKWCEKNLTD